MCGFPQRVERQKSMSDRASLVGDIVGSVSLEQSFQHILQKAAKPLALNQKPFFEWRIANVLTIEQVTPIEGHRSCNRLRRALIHELLEILHIDRDQRMIQR
jgi:hypothetical protein